MPRKYRNLSKSQYCKGKKCLKAIWLYQHKKDVADPPSDFQQNIFDQGTEVGKLATDYFPGGVEITEDYTQPEERRAIKQVNLMNNPNKIDQMKKNVVSTSISVLKI